MLGCFLPCPLEAHGDIAQWSLFLEAEGLLRYLLVLNYSLGIEEARFAYRIAIVEVFVTVSDDGVSGMNLHRLPLAESYAYLCQQRDIREVFNP